MSTVHSGSTLSSTSTSSSASVSSRSSSPLPSTSFNIPHARRQSLPRALKLVDGPPVTNRRSLDFASGDQTRRSVDGPPLRRSIECQPHRLRALADLRHLPTIPSPIEMPPPHNYAFSDLHHEQAPIHSESPASSSLFNHQTSSLSIDQPSTIPYSAQSVPPDAGPSSSNRPHPAATALITPPSTPTPVGRRKPSISYLPADSPSHHTRRRSSVVYRPNSPSIEPPTKHARRRSLLIRGSELAASNLVTNAQIQDGGEHGQTTSRGAEAQYATDSRPWWSSDVPASAPVLGTFDPPAEAIACHLPLHKQHAELLYSIAQEEARCAELRGQLAVREARLAGLKQRWEDRRAERWGHRASRKEEAEDVEAGDGGKEKEADADEDEEKDRESILEETMRKLEGRKAVDHESGNGGDATGNMAKRDKTPASSPSPSLRASSVSTTPVTDPTSPASSSTSSLSSTLSFSGIREARRWVRSLFVGRAPSPSQPQRSSASTSSYAPSENSSSSRPKCTAAQASYAPPQHRVSMPYASGLSAQPTAYESGAQPSDPVMQPTIVADERAPCDANRHWHRRTPSEMTIFAPEEEWVWAWYFVGR